MTTNLINANKFNRPAMLQWIRMLESGEFNQTKSSLRKRLSRPKNNNPYAHCCLGVVCEYYSEKVGGTYAMDNQTFIADFSTDARADEFFEEVASSSSEFLPLEVQEWLGLNNTAQSYLANMNDDGATFKEIAATLLAALKFEKTNGFAPGVAWWVEQADTWREKNVNGK